MNTLRVSNSLGSYKQVIEYDKEIPQSHNVDIN